MSRHKHNRRSQSHNQRSQKNSNEQRFKFELSEEDMQKQKDILHPILVALYIVRNYKSLEEAESNINKLPADEKTLHIALDSLRELKKGQNFDTVMNLADDLWESVFAETKDLVTGSLCAKHSSKNLLDEITNRWNYREINSDLFSKQDAKT